LALMSNEASYAAPRLVLLLDEYTNTQCTADGGGDGGGVDSTEAASTAQSVNCDVSWLRGCPPVNTGGCSVSLRTPIDCMIK